MGLARKGTPLTQYQKDKLKAGRTAWLKKHAEEKAQKATEENAMKASVTTMNIQGPSSPLADALSNIAAAQQYDHSSTAQPQPDIHIQLPEPPKPQDAVQGQWAQPTTSHTAIGMGAASTVGGNTIISGSGTSDTVSVSLKMITDMQIQIEELKNIKQVTGGGMTYEQMVYLLQEMKKPDEETQKKIDAEKARRAREQKDMIELALFEEARQKERWANCSHKKENGRSAFGGQMHSDGFYHPICMHCGYAAPPLKPTTEMMSMGVS